MLKSLLQKFHNKPVERGAYAVNTGQFIGEFFIFIKQENGDLHFLSLPKMLKRVVPRSNFNHGIQHKIITFVERLPKNVHELCKATYNRG